MGTGLEMRTPIKFAVLLCALVLVGCGNAPGVEDRRAELGAMLKRDKPAPAPRLSAAAVAASPAPLVEIRTDARHSVAVKVAETQGVASYASADGIGLALRDHMLASVKGLHIDVMSSTAPPAARIVAGSGAHRRSYQILDGLGQLQKLEFDCTVMRQGAEEITVAERVLATSVVAESCRNASGSFENRYWIDGRGKIRQSHQWIGSGVDFLRLSFG